MYAQIVAVFTIILGFIQSGCDAKRSKFYCCLHISVLSNMASLTSTGYPLDVDLALFFVNDRPSYVHITSLLHTLSAVQL